MTHLLQSTSNITTGKSYKNNGFKKLIKLEILTCFLHVVIYIFSLKKPMKY